jgi:hypothetical protein
MSIKSSIRGVLEVDDGNGKLVCVPKRNGIYDGMWDAVTGGAYTMQEKKMTPFDGDERVYPTVKEREKLTLESSFIYKDHQAIMQALDKNDDIRGRKAMVYVQVLDSEGHYQQNREAYPGMVLTVTGPDGDSNDASIAKISVVVLVGKMSAD